MFGCIERLIYLGKEVFCRIVFVRDLCCDADTDGHERPCALGCMRNSESSENVAEPVGYFASAARIGLRHDDGEFFAAVPCGQIGGTKRVLADDGGDGPKAFITGLMAM